MGGVAWWTQRNAKVRWAQHEALPEIIQLAGADKFDDAYRLAQQAQPYMPDDPLFAEQLRAISRRGIVSRSSGADAFYRRTAGVASLGVGLARRRSPAPAVPRGLLHWKVQMAGHETAEDVGPGPFATTARIRFALFPTKPGAARAWSGSQSPNADVPACASRP